MRRIKTCTCLQDLSSDQGLQQGLSKDARSMPAAAPLEHTRLRRGSTKSATLPSAVRAFIVGDVLKGETASDFAPEEHCKAGHMGPEWNFAAARHFARSEGSGSQRTSEESLASDSMVLDAGPLSSPLKRIAFAPEAPGRASNSPAAVSRLHQQQQQSPGFDRVTRTHLPGVDSGSPHRPGSSDSERPHSDAFNLSPRSETMSIDLGSMAQLHPGSGVNPLGGTNSGEDFLGRDGAAGVTTPQLKTLYRARSESLAWPCTQANSIAEDLDGEASAGGPARAQGSHGGPTSDGQAAVQLFFRLNHARQTVDFVSRQVNMYSRQTRGTWHVWDALRLLDSLREYETPMLQASSQDEQTGAVSSTSLLQHALQSAEACRLAFPMHDWLHLAGLLHPLGKLLAHHHFGAEPQWAICGESFPVGCQFSSSVICSTFFSANPDRRRRRYNTPTGMYWPGCGLSNVRMSWSAAEYLHLVLALNQTHLPPPALFLIRHSKFHALMRGGYSCLLDQSDRNMLPLLNSFQQLTAFRPSSAAAAVHLQSQGVISYYSSLINRYIPNGVLKM